MSAICYISPLFMLVDVSRLFCRKHCFFYSPTACSDNSAQHPAVSGWITWRHLMFSWISMCHIWSNWYGGLRRSFRVLLWHVLVLLSTQDWLQIKHSLCVGSGSRLSTGKDKWAGIKRWHGSHGSPDPPRVTSMVNHWVYPIYPTDPTGGSFAHLSRRSREARAPRLPRAQTAGVEAGEQLRLKHFSRKQRTSPTTKTGAIDARKC